MKHIVIQGISILLVVIAYWCFNAPVVVYWLIGNATCFAYRFWPKKKELKNELEDHLILRSK